MRYETDVIEFWSEAQIFHEAPDGGERRVLIAAEGEFDPSEPERWSWDPEYYDPGSGPECVSERISVCYSGDERGPWLDETRDFLRRFLRDQNFDARLDSEIAYAMYEAENDDD